MPRLKKSGNSYKTFKLITGFGRAPPWLSRCASDGGREAIPQIFVISPDARILKRFVGYSANYSAQLKQVLEDALK